MGDCAAEDLRVEEDFEGDCCLSCFPVVVVG